MIDTIARRTLLRLALLGGGALSLTGAVARAAATYEQGASAAGTEPSHSDDSEEERLWRHAGEFGGTGRAK